VYHDQLPCHHLVVPQTLSSLEVWEPLLTLPTPGSIFPNFQCMRKTQFLIRELYTHMHARMHAHIITHIHTHHHPHTGFSRVVKIKLHFPLLWKYFVFTVLSLLLWLCSCSSQGRLFTSTKLELEHAVYY